MGRGNVLLFANSSIGQPSAILFQVASSIVSAKPPGQVEAVGGDDWEVADSLSAAAPKRF